MSNEMCTNANAYCSLLTAHILCLQIRISTNKINQRWQQQKKRQKKNVKKHALFCAWISFFLPSIHLLKCAVGIWRWASELKSIAIFMQYLFIAGLQLRWLFCRTFYVHRNLYQRRYTGNIEQQQQQPNDDHHYQYNYYYYYCYF